MCAPAYLQAGIVLNQVKGQVIAFPNIYELFGADASAKVAEMEASLDQWAESQAHNAGAGPDALREVLGVQASIIVNDSGRLT